jgi:hypothetical protein
LIDWLVFNSNFSSISAISWRYHNGSNELMNYPKIRGVMVLSPLMLWDRILLRRGVLNTTLCDNVCQWLAAGLWFSLGTPVSSIYETDCYDITEILLKVASSTTTLEYGYLCYNVVLSTPRLSRIRTHNVSGEWHWLRR